ncbi:MAG: hypothetical protein C0407_16265 [Desulfobacca sp.]|nr:hypothetical protein [Desulfobacca sp.]
MKKIILFVSCIFLLFLTNFALASRPVPVIITGCVKGGLLISEQTDFKTHVSKGEYTIKTTDLKTNPVDLSRYEGKRLDIPGSLLPGDRFVIDPKKIEVLGNCP